MGTGVSEAIGVVVLVGDGVGVGVGGAVSPNETSSMRNAAGEAPLGVITTRSRAVTAPGGGWTAPVVRKVAPPGPACSTESVEDMAEPLASLVGYQEMRRYATFTPPSACTLPPNS